MRKKANSFKRGSSDHFCRDRSCGHSGDLSDHGILDKEGAFRAAASREFDSNKTDQFSNAKIYKI